MAVSVTHPPVAAPNNPAYEVSADAYNAPHVITGLGSAAEQPASAFEPANANIQAHVSAPHAPAGATVNSADAVLLARANHTGTQSADSVTDGTTNKAYTAAEKTKLAGVATGATVNSADATLLARANHTGTQAWSTLTGTPTTIAGYGITDAPVPAVAQLIVPLTGQTSTFNILSKDEVIALNHTATIAAHTVIFPSAANSAIGQELRLFSRSIVTALTLNTTGLTMIGAALTAMTANGNACWRKVAASTWARVQ